MKSDKSVIVLLLMLSLTEALLNETSTYLQDRKILKLQFPNKFELTGIIETTKTSEKGNRTGIKQKFIWKEDCFLDKSDLAKSYNSQIFDFHYRVYGKHYKYEYSNAGFTLIDSSKNEINCQVSMEIDGKHLSGLRSAVAYKRKLLNGGGHGYSSTRTAKVVTKFKDSKDLKSNNISRKRRVSDSVRRTSAELWENRDKWRFTVLSKSSKDRNIMAVRRHHEKIKTISTSCFRMRLDGRMPVNVRNKNENGPLKTISHLRRKVPKEVVDMYRRRNLQIRTQVSVLIDSRREKSDESKDTFYRTVSPVINEVRNENKEIYQKRMFQLTSQVKVNDNLKRRIFQSSSVLRGDYQKKMLLLSYEARQIVGEVSQRRIFKPRKEARVSRDREICKMRNEFINEIEAIRQKGIGHVSSVVRRITKGRSQGILRSKNELRNTISSARTSNVEIKKDVDRRLVTTHFNEARSRFERNVDSSYIHREIEVRNIAVRTISDSEDDAINALVIEGRHSAHINMDLNGRNTRRLSNTRNRKQLIRNRSGNPFITRSAIESRIQKRARISRVDMRKRQSAGMSFENRYFVKCKSFVDLRYQTVRELTRRNTKLIKFKNLASRGNMILQSKERRSRKDTIREWRNSGSLIYLRQFSSMLNFSELLSITDFRNVGKIKLDTHCSSERFSKISEQETYLDDNSTFANSLSTSTEKHVNIVALDAGKCCKMTPVSLSCCRFINNFESESQVNSVNNKRLLNLSESDINKWSRLADTNQNYSEFADLIPTKKMQQDGNGNLITSLGLAMTSLY